MEVRGFGGEDVDGLTLLIGFTGSFEERGLWGREEAISIESLSS